MTFASQLSTAFVPIDAVYDDAAVTRALSFAQSEVEAYCNRTFDTVTEIVFFDPKPHRQALLPQFPVQSVTELDALLPDPNGGSGFVWIQLTNFNVVLETGLVYDTTGFPGQNWPLNTPSWPWLPGSLKANYTHGYTTVPQGLVDVACRFAQQYLENPALMMQRRIGEQEGRFAGSSGVVFTELDQRILGRYTDIGF